MAVVLIGHDHPVNDTGARFIIDSVTREISCTAAPTLIQGDHCSERLTFEAPRLVDGHDLTQCNVVQVHYINIGSSTNEGVYEVDDLTAEGDSVTMSWLISRNATMHAGSLNFLVKFKCTDEDGNIVYEWNTAVYSGITVSTGIDNGAEIVEEYPDILAQWESRISALEENGGGGGGGASVLIVKVEYSVEDGLIIASHTASQIYGHVMGGGSVAVAYDFTGDRYFLNLCALDHAYAIFNTIYISRILEIKIFDDEVRYNEYPIGDVSEQLGDISTALDHIIQLQEELIE